MAESCQLTDKKCKPCEGGVDPIAADDAKKMLGELPGWKLMGNKIEKEYQFKDFVKAIAFVNQLAELAESEGHHPDISVHYNKVLVSLWTHAIGGLSENDFIVAAKTETLG